MIGLELFQTGPLTALDQREMQVMVHGLVVTQDAAHGGYDVSALVSEVDGRTRLVPWEGLTLDFRWDKDRGWFVEGEEQAAAASSAPLKPKLVAALRMVLAESERDADTLADDLIAAMEDA